MTPPRTRPSIPAQGCATRRRARLSPRERADILFRQGGTCCVKGCDETHGLEEEHSAPVALGGNAKPDQLMCKAHHAAKTFGLRGDITNIAKAKRIRDGRTQFDKRKAAGGSRIHGASFRGWRNFKGEAVFK